MQNDPMHALEEADDAADLMHCAVLYASDPDALRTMCTTARRRGPERAVQRHAVQSVHQALAALMPAMRSRPARSARRIAVMAMQLHLDHVLHTLCDPALHPSDAEALILSARSRAIADQREARAL